MAREIRKFNIYIAVLSEIRLAEEGQLREDKGGYTFFWKGMSASKFRVHGVGFKNIKNNLVMPDHSSTKAVVGNLMTTVVGACAPTLDSPVDIKEAFYDSLDNVLSAIPKEDKIILLGDLPESMPESVGLQNMERHYRKGWCKKISTSMVFSS